MVIALNEKGSIISVPSRLYFKKDLFINRSKFHLSHLMFFKWSFNTLAIYFAVETDFFLLYQKNLPTFCVVQINGSILEDFFKKNSKS